MLRIGIIGCGNIFKMHADSVAYLENAEIVGVCDIKKERADVASQKYNCKAYYDYKELIDKKNIDVVHICIPHYLHAVVSKYAIMKGVHVLCEKPMSIKYEDAAENVTLAEQNNVKYGVVFQCRYNNAPIFVKEKIEDGTLGKIISARVVLTWCKPNEYYSQSDWKGTWEKEGGGVVINQAIHSIDMANWFIDDEIESVSAHMANRNHSIIEVEDSAEGLIKYKNGATLGFWAMSNYGCDDPIEIRLLCEKGKVVMDYENAVITMNNGEQFEAKEAPRPVDVLKGGKDYWGTGHIRQIADFYKSVENNTEPKISGREALKVQKLICEIYKEGTRSVPLHPFRSLTEF